MKVDMVCNSIYKGQPWLTVKQDAQTFDGRERTQKLPRNRKMLVIASERISRPRRFSIHS